MDVRWRIGLSSLVIILASRRPVFASADVQAGNYHLTVTPSHGLANGAPGTGPLQGILPQMNELQQWALLGLLLLGTCLLMLLITICRRNWHSIKKEQP